MPQEVTDTEIDNSDPICSAESNFMVDDYTSITAGCGIRKSMHYNTHRASSQSLGQKAQEPTHRDTVTVIYIWDGEFKE